MLDRDILKLRGVTDIDDAKNIANIEESFMFMSKGLSGKGKLLGTTFSGHPTATTLMGTTRNLLYHLFNAFRKRSQLGIEIEVEKAR